MKKFAVFAGVMVLGATVALASSLSVPFFLDRVAAGSGFPPNDNNAATFHEATFVGIHNNLSVDLVVEIDYFDAGQNGTVDQQTPSPNTFLLPANASFSFRPVQHDPATEVGGAAVPNMPGGETAGSAIITWVGGPADIQGRLVQYHERNPDGQGGQVFSYLLPPGF